MGLELGIVGLPNVGKSTLFRALSSAPAEVANYPFCTIEPNVGIVGVPDFRLERLAQIFGSDKTIPNALKTVDIAGLVKGASRGEGLGARFLDHIGKVDAIVHVVRGFEDGEILHVDNRVDPVADADIIKTELLLSDLEKVERKIEKLKKESKGRKGADVSIALLENLAAHLSLSRQAKDFQLSDEGGEKIVDELNLLTAKPFFYLLNVAEEDLDRRGKHEEAMREQAEREDVELLKICGSLESELAELESGEKAAYLESVGIRQSGLEQAIAAGFKILDQITFFTAGPKETRAWNLRRNSTAPEAAGKIHGDMRKGFIRVEAYGFDDIDGLGSELEVKNRGKLRIEGQDYIVQDGDVLHVRFNV